MLRFLSWLALLAAPADAGLAAGEYPLDTLDFRIRDPFLYADRESRTYYLYASTGNTPQTAALGEGVVAYQSQDLVRWSEPQLVFRKPDGFWGGSEIWAPELHRFGRRFYLFVTFNGRHGGRGTQIFRAESPVGPFQQFSADARTPPEQTCLDGTPFVEADGSRWLVYCHEWVQIGDGAIRAVKMKEDWSAREGEPVELFRASQAPWVKPLGRTRQRAGEDSFVTDGPWLHRFRDGKLLMLWSSFGEEGYTVGIAESDNGRIDGHWTQRPQPLLATDGGHCMLLKTFDGRLKLVLHQPNGGGRERARLIDVMDTGRTIVVFGGDSSLPPGARHGCILSLSSSQLEALLAAYDRPQP